ncbi:hypothetical protein F2P56_033530 [Juglans regia]|uniref:Uncharacterized protein n=2 Tax=Juglans regia TaxID=51240 RepID=A0A833U0Q3_JUGRE|nr:uncharacterized protein LOC109003260 [Juglans regia]KAF5448023.1 hypothetical protein F2P56_033530 [Juglans regia]
MNYFYEGLTPRERQFVKMMRNSEFLQKDPDEAIEYLNELAEKLTLGLDLVLLRAQIGHDLQETQMVVEENNEIKSQVSKFMSSLSVNKRGNFPSQAQSIPQGQHMAQGNLKEVNAIMTRCGKSSHIPTTNKLENVEEEQSKDSAELLKEAEVIKNPVKVPFPQVLKSGMRTLDSSNEILENLRQVKINLHLLHVIKQVPTYTKVLKNLYTVKRKHHVKKTAFLTEQVSALIEQRIPPKYKDPGCPTIAYNIGNHEFGQALLDLGASVNLMPYSIYLQLGLGEIKSTSVVLQLANRSVKKPRGIVEDEWADETIFWKHDHGGQHISHQ